MDVPTLDLRTGEIWISFDGGWDGLRTIDALFDPSQGSVTMRLYNNALQEIASSFPTATGASLLHSGQTGAPYFLRITGTNPSVHVQISEPVQPAVAGSATQSASEPAQTANSTSTSVSFSRASLLASANPAAAPAAEPLVAPDASDEALAEEEEWVVETLLA
jgi:hypothetical protein